MVNIWDYQPGTFIKLTSVDNKIFSGKIVCLWDSDELEEDCDCLDLETDDAIIGFRPEEIIGIEKIKS